MSSLKWTVGQEGTRASGQHWLQATSPAPHATEYVAVECANGRWYLEANGGREGYGETTLWQVLALAETIEECKCPGCGCDPGDGRTTGCNHPEGCGLEG